MQRILTHELQLQHQAPACIRCRGETINCHAEDPDARTSTAAPSTCMHNAVEGVTANCHAEDPDGRPSAAAPNT